MRGRRTLNQPSVLFCLVSVFMSLGLPLKMSRRNGLVRYMKELDQAKDKLEAYVPFDILQ